MSDHAMQRPRVVCRRLAVSYTRRLQTKTREASRSCDGAPIEERWAVALASRRPPRHGTSRAPATRWLASSTAGPSPPSIGREAILSLRLQVAPVALPHIAERQAIPTRHRGDRVVHQSAQLALGLRRGEPFATAARPLEPELAFD